MTVIRGHKGIGAPVRGIALVAADNFSARYDLDRVQGVFSRPAHKLFGQRYVGKETLRAFFSDLMARCPDIQWHPIDNRADGNKGFSEWRRQCTLPDGTKQDWLGLDIFTFRGGKVIRKDTYFKIVA